jgi:hypothetical protein
MSGFALSQTENKKFYLWKLHSIRGEARLNGLYREQERIGLNFNEYQKSSYLSGGLLLNTNSSILNKNFLELDIDAGYMPETSQENFITIPDQAEVRTMKKLGVSASFLKQKKVTLNLFGNYDENYSSRENLTDIKSINKHLGGTLNYANKFLPVTIDFHNRKWYENEIQTGRRYTLDQNTFGARTYKSFGKLDRSEFKYSHDENLNVNQNMFRVANTIDNVDFISSVYLDANKKYSFNTLISNFNQKGNTNLKRFQISENVNVLLPYRLSISGNYNFNNIRQDVSTLIQNSINTSLQHKLFESLQSKINLDYNFINHTVFQEFNSKTGVEFNYSKKIPTGQLLINYRFDRYHQNYTSEPSALNVNSELYILSDNEIKLLKVTDIILGSVVVKDISSTIIYIDGIDYILIERNKYIEIRRIPGGSIANNSSVLIDYTATQPGKYKYDANIQMFSSNIYLFKNILSLNYRFAKQDYSNMEGTTFVALNYFTQNQVGIRLDFEFINGGAEYEDYQSSILPYRMMRYYANFQKNYKEKVLLMINGNMQDYVMLDEPEPKYQKYMDFTGKIIYMFIKKTSLNVDMVYRKQTGRGIDLDLFTSKTEIITSINLLYITLGAEIYKRNYVGEQINFKGAYVKIARKF